MTTTAAATRESSGPYGPRVEGPVFVCTRGGRNVGPFPTFIDAVKWADATFNYESAQVLRIEPLLTPANPDAAYRG